MRRLGPVLKTISLGVSCGLVSALGLRGGWKDIDDAIEALDGWEGDFRWVPHHVAHAASGTFASGFDPCGVASRSCGSIRASRRLVAGRCAGGCRTE